MQISGWDSTIVQKMVDPKSINFIRYLLLPFVFLTVTLLGGLRLSVPDNAFVFLRPDLICLVFAAVLCITIFRSDVVKLGGLVSEKFALARNIAGGAVLLPLFTATVQVFNSVLPEKGLLFWIVGFFFFWTLWNNLFAEFKGKRLLQSIGSTFGLAFIVKYLVIANLAVPEETLMQRIFSGLMKEASFGLLDLPKFSPATGYIQFFCLGLYLVGLTLLSSNIGAESNNESSTETSESIS